MGEEILAQEFGGSTPFIVSIVGEEVRMLVWLPDWIMWVTGATLIASLLSLAIMSYLAWCWWQAGR